MPEKIKATSLNFSQLYTEESAQVISRFLTDWDASGYSFGNNEDYPILFQNLRDSYAAYSKALLVDKPQASTSTPELVAADRLRDEDLKIFRQQVKSFATTSRPQDAADYQLLSKLLADYKNVERTHFENESAKIDKLLEKLKAEKYVTALENLGLTRFVTRLTESQADFDKLYKASTKNQLETTYTTIKPLRQAMIEDYTRLVDYTVLLMSIRKDAYFQDVFKILEAGRKHYADIISHRLASKKKKPTDPETDQ